MAGRTKSKGRSWRPAVVVAVAWVAAWGAGASPAVAASGGSGASPQPGAGATTTTTLPALPQVGADLTDGQPASQLLSQAIALSSVGVDDTALLSALATTQAKLDADAAHANAAHSAAVAATERANRAEAAARSAAQRYENLKSAVKDAVLYLYTAGPMSLAPSPDAGSAALFAEAYAESTITPYGVLASSRKAASDQRAASTDAQSAEKQLAAADAAQSRDLAGLTAQIKDLQAEIQGASATSAAAVATDQVLLAKQAGQELTGSRLQFTPASPVPAPVSTTSVALTWAFSELGKPYLWGGTGPDSFDCSGLTQFAWHQAGVDIPRVAADQYSWTVPVPLSQLLPGDLVFFGSTDIHHVGIYIGAGLMINAPHTGDVVRVSSIWWSDLAGFGRVHYPGTPVPPHAVPSATQPAAKVVVSAAPVPSQTAPPPGWAPAPGETAPISAGPSPSTTTVPPDSTTTAPSATTTTLSGTSTTTTSIPSSPTSVGASAGG